MDRFGARFRGARMLVLVIVGVTALAVSGVTTAVLAATPFSSTFRYEGRLGAVTGHYDFTFRLYDALTAGHLVVSTTIARPNVLVDTGEYRVDLDFGLPAFNGLARYLEVRYRVHTTSTTAPYTLQSPRTEVDPVPYAIRARSAAIAGDANHALNANHATNADHALNADYATNAGNAFSADTLGGYTQGSFYKGSTDYSYTSPNTLAAGATQTITTFGWNADLAVMWRIKPLYDTARLRLTVDQQYHSGDNSFTYYLTVLNDGPVASTYTLTELSLHK